MKYLSIVLISICLYFPHILEEQTIPWQSSYKLSWDDFKGNPQTDTDAVAVTASGITFSYSVQTKDSKIISFNTKAEAHFYPDKSWYLKDRANTYILAHEQLHFDITELHVRKFRKQIEFINVSQNLRSDLDQLHQKINKALYAMQKQYDSESNNSINKEQQAHWIEFVYEELKKLENYKSKY